MCETLYVYINAHINVPIFLLLVLQIMLHEQLQKGASKSFQVNVYIRTISNKYQTECVVMIMAY